MASKKKKKKVQGSEFDTLLEVGFKLSAPQDEFSYQPDSGSSTGGLLGEQEHGIKSDYDAEGRIAQIQTDHNLLRGQNALVLVSDESKLSSEQPLPDQERVDDSAPLGLGDSQLLDIIERRITENPHIGENTIELHMKNRALTVTGEVHSEAAKLLIEEILGVFPEIKQFNNNVSVLRPGAK